jgi:hypothetical protein
MRGEEADEKMRRPAKTSVDSCVSGFFVHGAIWCWRWSAFLHNHREAIATMDFNTGFLLMASAAP